MKRLQLLLAMLFTQLLVLAQEGGANLDVDVDGGADAGSFPWLWVIIGIVVLILLIVMLSGGRSDRVVEKRTVIKKDDEAT